MMPATATIVFQARLLRPASAAKGATWSFLILPDHASGRLSTRAMASVEGAINGQFFRATLQPDGQKGHWLKVTKALRESAGAKVGDLVELRIVPAAKEPQPRVPADLRAALASNPQARLLWSVITPIARRDWIQWITSAKRPQTRARRVQNACAMLAAGKRRVCCFDRTGFYSKSLCAPIPAE